MQSRTICEVIEMPRPTRSDELNRGAKLINESLDDYTVHAFKSMLINWAVSPQLLCVYSNQELDYLHEAIRQEKTYRTQERKLQWS